MVSKMVTDRQKLSEDLVAWANTHAPALAAALAERMDKGAPGSATIAGLAAYVHGGLGALVKADEAHAKELADDVLPRSARDAASEEVATQLVGLRKKVDATHGRAGLLALGIHERLAYDAVYVQRLATRVVSTAKAHGFKMPPADPDLKIDLPALIDKLEGPLAKLTAALKAVDKETAELKTTQSAKDAAMAAFDARFVAGAGALRCLAALAGLTALADSVPFLKRGSAAGAQEEDEPGEAPDAGGGPA